jgi:integrase
MNDTRFIAKLRGKLTETDTLPSSQQRVIIDCRQFEGWYAGTYDTEIDPEGIRLTSVDLAEFRTWLLKKCQPGTVQRKFASLRAMLKLLAPGLLSCVRMPKLPASPQASPSGWSRQERLAILRAVARLKVRDQAICTLLIWTGCRVSSAANLKLSNVKLGARSGSVIFDVLKGGRESRTVTIPANTELREALAEWIKERPPVKHDFLFTGEKYPFSPLTRWTCHDIWHRRVARHLPQELAARLKGPHQARHALARLLLEQGVPLPDVAAILGHTSVATTANIYCRPSEQDLRRHLERAIGEEPEE